MRMLCPVHFTMSLPPVAFPSGVFNAPDEQFLHIFPSLCCLDWCCGIFRRGGGCNPDAYSSVTHIWTPVIFPHIYLLTRHLLHSSLFPSYILPFFPLTFALLTAAMFLYLLASLYTLVLFCPV